MSLTAGRPDAQTARSFWTMQRRDSERMFVAARKHSRRVRILRIAVPLGVGLFLTVFVMWTWFNPMRLLFKIPNVGGDLVISGSKITMQSPRVTGYTRDSRPYELSAKAAAQDLTRPDVVELSELRAKFGMQDNTTTELVTQTGIFNSKKEVLDLNSQTTVTSNNYKVFLNRAQVDIRAHQLTSDEPVRVEMARGVLDAGSLQILEAGALLRFENVKMTVQPPESTAK